MAINIFEGLFKKILNEATEDTRSELEIALNRKASELKSRNVIDKKSYEIAFQDVIEGMFPGNMWWEVTNCNIFWALFSGETPESVIKMIIDGLNDEFKEKETDETKDDVDESVLGDKIRKGDLEYDDDVDGLKAEHDGVEVEFQDRESHAWHGLELKTNKYGGQYLGGNLEKHPRVSSNTIARVWDKNTGDFKRFEGSKYEVRKEVADYLDSMYESLGENEKLVIYKALGTYCVTPESNYNKNMQNARAIQKLNDFESSREIMDYYNKYFGTNDDSFIVIDESCSKKLNETADGADELWSQINNNEYAYNRLAEIVKKGIEEQKSKDTIALRVRKAIFSMKDDFGRIYTTQAERAQLAKDFVEDETSLYDYNETNDEERPWVKKGVWTLKESMVNESADLPYIGNRVFVAKNQFNYNIIGIIVDDENKKYQLVDGQQMKIGKYPKRSAKAIREMADELSEKGYERVHGDDNDIAYIN